MSSILRHLDLRDTVDNPKGLRIGTGTTRPCHASRHTIQDMELIGGRLVKKCLTVLVAASLLSRDRA
jgi:hypothetical protein